MLRTLLIETVVYGVTWKYECLSVCVIVYCRYQAESGSRLNEKEIADWLAVCSVCWRIGWGNSFMHVPNCHLSVLLSTEMEWVLYIYFITVHILLLPPHYKWSCYISVIMVICLCLLVMTVNPAKTDERIEMPFGMWTCGVPRIHELDEGPDPLHGKGHVWGEDTWTSWVCTAQSKITAKTVLQFLTGFVG